jgi:conjugative relaxase-like TrwC/TraI family protein
MLSLSNVSSGAKAAEYYEQTDDYYVGDRSPSGWTGQAAKELGRGGPVKPEDFLALLSGRLPNGVRLQAGNETEGRRGGTDMTWSAPKSLSMQSLIAGDRRLVDAHETAVSRALVEAERLAACRMTVGGVTVAVGTGNLAIACFRHDLSRDADPQLHTHAVALNLTRRPDGQWRALHNEGIYRQKMWLGAFYRSELAREVRALGYEVRQTHGDGRFELAHITPAQVEAFSSRSQATKQALRERGIDPEHATARQKQMAVLQTRKTKEVHDRGNLLQEWKERAAEAGVRFEAPEARSERSLGDEAMAAVEAVGYAVRHLTERESIARRVDIERFALERGTGHTELTAIRAAIELATSAGDLIAEGDLFTTPAAQQRERDILAMEISGRGRVQPLMSQGQVQLELLGQPLNEGQLGVVAHVLCSADRVIGIQGSAGTGKTTALRAVRELAQARGLKLVGVAPSAAAARELAGSGIDSGTLAALAERGYRGLNDKTLLVMDEAGMTSAGDMYGLLRAAESVQARVVLVGDVRQLKSVEAGRPFEQLQQAGMPCVALSEIMRQEDAQLKAAVTAAAAGETTTALSLLKERVVEIQDSAERHQRIAQVYVGLDEEARAQTLIVAGTNASRQAINEAVRQALGRSGNGVEVTILRSRNLTAAQAQRTVSYEVGDVLCAGRDYKSLGLRRGQMATVVAGAPGPVTLERGDGVKVAWWPLAQPHLSAFTSHEREMSVGDVVRFTRNESALGVINGERATVQSIDGGELVLRTDDGAVLRLQTDTPLHIDHAYARTVYAGQGLTCDRVLIEAPASDVMANDSSFYVGISRARHEVTIFTDDAELLPCSVARIDSKTAALDIGAKEQEKEVELG